MRTLNEMLDEISEFVPDVREHVTRVFGWRGLFDPYSDEYTHTDLNQKAAVLRLLLDHVTFSDLIDSYLFTETREYVVAELPVAVHKLCPILPAAKAFFFESPVCEQIRRTHSDLHEADT